MKTVMSQGNLIYLFEVINGITDNSQAIETAKLNGLPKKILERATKLKLNKPSKKTNKE